ISGASRCDDIFLPRNNIKLRTGIADGACPYPACVHTCGARHDPYGATGDVRNSLGNIQGAIYASARRLLARPGLLITISRSPFIILRVPFAGSVTKTASGSSMVFPEVVLELAVVLFEEVAWPEGAQAAVIASTPTAPVPTEACVI